MRLLVWWVVLFGLWFAFVGEVNGVEAAAAAIAATLGTAIAAIVRGQGELRFRLRVRWLRELASLPAIVVEDCAIVLAALGRRGSFHTRSGPKGLSAEDAGRAAFLAYTATVSPNSYVVDADREQGTVLVHDLVTRRRSEEPV